MVSYLGSSLFNVSVQNGLGWIMNFIKQSFIVLCILVAVVSCKESNDGTVAKEAVMEFSYELLFDANEVSSDYFLSNYYLFNPPSVYLRDDDLYLAVENGVYSFNLKSDNGVSLNYSITKELFEYLNYNQPNRVAADSFKNLYVENIKYVESVVSEGKSSKKGKSSNTFYKKTNHKIFKFDYEGKFLYSIGSNGKDDPNSFGIYETLYLMHVDDFDNLSIIIGSYDVNGFSDVNEFTKDNVDIYKYRFVKYNSAGDVVSTINFSDIDELNVENENFVRVIQNIEITPLGDFVVISTVDQRKVSISENEYYIDSDNSRLYFYDLNANQLNEQFIDIDNKLYYMFGISNKNEIFLCRPENVYELRFMVVDFKGQIKENKKIILNNVRQKRYNLFFDREGYISAIFLENDKVRITQYR